MEARQREGARTSEEAKAREGALAEELEARGKVLARVEAQVVTASPPQLTSVSLFNGALLRESVAPRAGYVWHTCGMRVFDAYADMHTGAAQQPHKLTSVSLSVSQVNIGVINIGVPLSRTQAARAHELSVQAAESAAERARTLEEEAAALRAERTAAVREVKLLRETVARLEQDAAGAAQTQGAKMASLGAEVKAARGRAEELEAELERKQRDFDAKSASLQRQVEGAVQQAVHGGEREQRLQADKTGLEQRLTQACRRLEEQEALAAELRRTSDTAERQLRRAHESAEAAAAAAAAAADAAARRESELEDRCAALERACGLEQKRAASAVASAEDALAQAVGEARALRSELGDAHSALAGAEQERRAAREAAVRHEALASEADTAQARVRELSRELAASQKALDAALLDRQQADLRAATDVERAREQVAAAEAGRAEAESGREAAAAALRAEREAAGKGRVAALDAHADLGRECDALRTRVEELQTQAQDAVLARAGAESASQRLQQALDLATEQLAAAGREVVEEQRGRVAAEERGARADEGRRDAEARLEAVVRAKKETAQELHDACAKISVLEQELAALEPQGAALDLSVAASRDLERKLREAELREGQLQRRLMDADKRASETLALRQADLAQSANALREAEAEVQAAHASRREVQHKLERAKLDLSSVSAASAARGGRGTSRERQREDDESQKGQLCPGLDQRGHSSAGGDTEELTELGRLQKARIEDRLACILDAKRDCQDPRGNDAAHTQSINHAAVFLQLLDADDPPDAFRSTLLAFLCILELNVAGILSESRPLASSSTPWSEVRSLVPREPWREMQQLPVDGQGERGDTHRTREIATMAAKILARVTPAEAWAVGQACGLIHEWINVVIDVRRLALD